MSGEASQNTEPEGLFKTNQVVNLDANELKHTICDPDGDRKILAGSGRNRVLFTVSSNAMSLACRPWKAMLGKDGKFLEASALQIAPIEFPDDDVNALGILLNVAHLRFSSVPATLTSTELRQVAELADKYDVSSIVQPWLVHWIREAQINDQVKKLTSFRRWSHISWIFGLKEMFKTITEGALEEITRSATGEFSWKGCLLRDACLPLGVSDTLIEARNEAIDKIFNYCYATCAFFVPGGKGFCRAGSSDRFIIIQRRKPCDVMSYGSLIMGLEELKIWPERKPAKNYDCSLKALIEGVKNIEFHRYHHHPAQYGDCKLTGSDLKAYLALFCNTALNDAKEKMEEKYRVHMTRQAEQCPVKACPVSSGSSALTF